MSVDARLGASRALRSSGDTVGSVARIAANACRVVSNILVCLVKLPPHPDVCNHRNVADLNFWLALHRRNPNAGLRGIVCYI